MFTRSSPLERVAAVRRTRAAAAKAAVGVFGGDLDGWSEEQLCRRWAAGLKRDSSLLAEGWYSPPPGGVSVLVSDPPGYGRTNYESLRHRSSWPSADRSVSPGSVLYAYASPVDRRMMMIGDIGFTLYRGDDRVIRSHIAECLDVTSRVVQFAEVGMEFRELYHHAMALMREAGVTNETANSTGKPDIGHTVPWSYDHPTVDEIEALDSADRGRIASAISAARVFLDGQETRRILPTMAFTVEPRMASPGLPSASFHVIVTFAQSVKEVCVDFGPVLEAHGMLDYIEPGSLTAMSA